MEATAPNRRLTGRMPNLLAFLLLVAAACQLEPAASASPSAPASSLAVPAPAPAPAPVARGHGSRRAGQSAEAEFVRGCCARTRYPRLCYAGLAPHAAAVHSSLARLALASANLTLAALDALAARIPPPGGSGALSDCAEAVASAEDQAARAAGRLAGVEQAVGRPELLWRVDDALTWLSAAMTYEDSCADGLGPRKSAPAPVRAELRARVRRAKQYTSIALALVNSLVSDNPRS